MNAEEMILRELSHGGFASGEEISRKLKISRAAVWKHIVKLRAAGYRIDALPRRGYRLAHRPDKLLAAELAPLISADTIGARIVHREEIGSTTQLARELIGQVAPEGTVILAEHQTAARGRLGRTWQAPAGETIAMSVILYPPFAPVQAPLLSLATGVAAVRAIESVAPVKPLLKWPNDVYIEGRKLGGILVEMAAELDRIRWIIDSIGLNVNNSFTGTGLENRATSLAAETGQKVSRRRLTAAIVNELDGVYAAVKTSGFASLAADFERLDMLRGLEVTVAVPEGEVSGVAEGVDDRGRLLVRQAGCGVRALLSGEATISSWHS